MLGAGGSRATRYESVPRRWVIAATGRCRRWSVCEWVAARGPGVRTVTTTRTLAAAMMLCGRLSGPYAALADDVGVHHRRAEQ